MFFNFICFEKLQYIEKRFIIYFDKILYFYYIVEIVLIQFYFRVFQYKAKKRYLTTNILRILKKRISNSLYKAAIKQFKKTNNKLF